MSRRKISQIKGTISYPISQKAGRGYPCFNCYAGTKYLRGGRKLMELEIRAISDKHLCCLLKF